jgi:hypothetical protein
MADVFSPTAADRPGADAGAAWPSPRIAARGLYASSVTMVASMVAISLFFGGAGAIWGPINDLLVVATVLLLLPAVAVLPRLVGPVTARWFTLVSMAAAVGIAVIATGQLALVAGLITLDTSFLTGGLGVVPVIAWVGATAVPALRVAAFGRAMAGWAIGLVTLIGITIVVLATLATDTPTLTGVLGLPLMVTLLGWLLSTARAIERAARSQSAGMS